MVARKFSWTVESHPLPLLLFPSKLLYSSSLRHLDTETPAWMVKTEKSEASGDLCSVR